MEVFDELAHSMEKSWNSMCEPENDRDMSSRTRVTQGFNTPSHGKLAGAYLCVSRASREGKTRPLLALK
jgi:hypothetical protein